MSLLSGIPAAVTALPSLAAELPSPSVGVWHLGPLPIRGYALCILAGIVVAVWLTQRRLSALGYKPGVAIDISAWAVPFGIVGGRLYHLITTPQPYFGEGGDPWRAFAIYEGGLGIWGAVALGAVGAWIGCRKNGVTFRDFVDAAAPGVAIAQAMGRFGNWFNQELYGLPTDLPWGLEIDADNPAFPPGLAPGTLFHPTFLYEVIWNVLGVLFLLWVGNRFRLQWGRLFGLYLVWYSAGRIVWESIRIDPSEIILGLRSNVWAAILGVILGLVIFFVQKRRHPGSEPSPYVPGREWTPAGTVQSQDTGDFVDVSEPPTDEVTEGTATSTHASK